MAIDSDVILGRNVSIPQPGLVNLYGCIIGDESRIGAFVEIQKNVRIGSRCKISSHAFVCEGVTIEDDVFVGHGVTFTNDLYPAAVNSIGDPKDASDWTCIPTLVGRGAALGSNATILAGVTIGASALIGAGAVVTADISPGAIVAGNPARVIGQRGINYPASTAVSDSDVP